MASRWVGRGPGCPTGPAKNSPAPIRAVRSPGEGVAASKKPRSHRRIDLDWGQGLPSRRRAPGTEALGRAAGSRWIFWTCNPAHYPLSPPSTPPAPAGWPGQVGLFWSKIVLVGNPKRASPAGVPERSGIGRRTVRPPGVRGRLAAACRSDCHPLFYLSPRGGPCSATLLFRQHESPPVKVKVRRPRNPISWQR